MPAKFSWIPVAVFCVLVFSWSVYRDIQLEKQDSCDLRNRVVGARMQKDGLSPYFYKWKKGDGLRYYDPNNFDSLRVSNITASPFFHYLLYPISDLPQRTISVIWLIAEYLMLVIIVLLALALATTRLQQWLVIITACLLLLTEAWKMHMGKGQNYICIVLGAMLFYYCLRKKTPATALLAGICAVMLVLIKPPAILFFIPFLFWVKTFGPKLTAICMLPLIIAGVWVLTSKRERYLWKQYQENITQQIQLHQQEWPPTQANAPDPMFPVWEGIDRAAIKQQAGPFPDKIFSENGNFFVVAQQLFHKKVNKTILSVLSVVCLLLLLLAFYKRHRAAGFALPDLAITGFCLFMIADLFSPVYRHQYYTVLWMFPLLLSAAMYQPLLQKIYLVLAVGLLLNVVNIPVLPMEHTMGEYIMLVGFIVLSLRRKTGTV